MAQLGTIFPYWRLINGSCGLISPTVGRLSSFILAKILLMSVSNRPLRAGIKLGMT